MDRRAVNLLLDDKGNFLDEQSKYSYMLMALSDIADNKIEEAIKISEEANKLMECYKALVVEVEGYQERIKKIYNKLLEIEEAQTQEGE